MQLETTRDAATWDGWLREAGVGDVYFSLRYAQVWAAEERAEAVGVRGHSASGTVLYPVLRIALDSLEPLAGHVDVRTAYDFGGARMVAEDPEATARAWDEAWRALCEEWRVVTEFARLHPFAALARPPEAAVHAHNYFADVSRGVDAARAEGSSVQRKNVKTAARAGVETLVAPADAPRLDAFLSLYAATMARLEAAPHYHFSRQALAAVASLPETVLATASHAGEVLAAALFLRSDDTYFYFLSASSDAARPVCANNALLDAALAHAAAAGATRVHLGAGSESLRKFKERVGPHQVPYSILRAVRDPAAYERAKLALPDLAGNAEFPFYRTAHWTRLHAAR